MPAWTTVRDGTTKRANVRVYPAVVGLVGSKQETSVRHDVGRHEGEAGMGRRIFLAFVTILGLLSPSHAFDVAKGECQRILSGQARVHIHFSSGLKVEIDPTRPDNVIAQVEIYPDGRRVPQTWLVGGGLLPSESPWGKFAYAEPIDFRFEPGETRRFSYALKAGDSRTSSGTMVFTVEGLEKAAFGECQATVVTITNATAGADGRPYTRIRRRFIRELRYFTFSTIEVLKDGKSKPVIFEATRIEIIQ
jgi:hypothetical protein